MYSSLCTCMLYNKASACPRTKEVRAKLCEYRLLRDINCIGVCNSSRSLAAEPWNRIEITAISPKAHQEKYASLWYDGQRACYAPCRVFDAETRPSRAAQLHGSLFGIELGTKTTRAARLGSVSLASFFRLSLARTLVTLFGQSWERCGPQQPLHAALARRANATQLGASKRANSAARPLYFFLPECRSDSPRFGRSSLRCCDVFVVCVESKPRTGPNFACTRVLQTLCR